MTTITRDTTCNESNKNCDIIPSKQPSLAAMNLMYCVEHTEVVSYDESKVEDDE